MREKQETGCRPDYCSSVTTSSPQSSASHPMPDAYQENMALEYGKYVVKGAEFLIKTCLKMY